MADPAYPSPPQGPTPVRNPSNPSQPEKEKPTGKPPDSSYHGGKDPDPSKT